jgi:hypothetical protein
MKIPTTIPGFGFYHHYKHNPQGPINVHAYELMGVGCHTKDNCRPEDANLAVYRPLYEEANIYKAGKLFYVRPLAMFTETITKDGKTFPRFIKITDASVIAQLKEIRDRLYPPMN